MAHGSPVTLGAAIIFQGEVAVGSGTVQLHATIKSCSRIWVGAPSVKHTKGAQNTTPILIGKNSTSNAGGGMFLDTTDSKGFFVPGEDPTKVYLTGFTASDVVECIIFA